MSLPRSLVLSSFLLLLLPQNSRAIDWLIETVDDEYGAGVQTSLTLDSQGIPHIVYLQNGLARYATKTGELWYREYAGYGDYRAQTTIVIVPGDVPAFSHQGVYRARTPQGWSHEDMGGFGPWSSTIALSPNGDIVGMTQWSWGSGLYQGFVDAVYRRQDGSWGSSPLMDAVFIPNNQTASMVVDALGNPHMSVTPTQGDPLWYWHRDNNNAWTSKELMPGMWSSIALDANGSPRISFYDPVQQNLTMAFKVNNDWQAGPIDFEGDVGLYTSLAFRDDVWHIAYYDKTNGDLKYAVLTTNSTVTTRVDTEGDVGKFASLALDAQGRPHIAYHDVTHATLKYAVGNTPVPVRKTTLGSIKALYR